MILLTDKQKLILFLISCNPEIRDIYTMVKVFDRADFPSEMSKNLKRLLDNHFIIVSKNFDNGTPSTYGMTEQGMKFLRQTFNVDATIEYIKAMDNPEQLLKIATAYIGK